MTTYADILDEYYEIIAQKFERGLITEEKFRRLLGKLGEWDREGLRR